MTKRLGAPEVEQAFARAYELSDKLGTLHQHIFVLLGLWGSSLTRGNLRAAQGLADQALRAAQQSEAAPLQVWAHYAWGMTQYYTGGLTVAREHLRQSIAR